MINDVDKIFGKQLRAHFVCIFNFGRINLTKKEIVEILSSSLKIKMINFEAFLIKNTMRNKN